MKNLKIGVLILLALSQSFTLQALQRRAGTVASRGYFTRTGTPSSFISETSSRTPVTCPNASSRSNYFGRDSWKSGSTQQRPYHISKGAARIANLPYGTEVAEVGWKAGKFVARHKGKLLGAGTACATYGIGKTLSEKEERIELELKTFKISLKDYTKENDKELITETIERLKKEGALNKKYQSGDTPLLMVIKAKLNEPDKADIVKMLIESGAKPEKEAIVRALEFSKNSVFNLNSTRHVSWSELNYNNEILKIILPHYDQKTLLDFLDIVDEKIDENQVLLNTKKRNLKTLHETYNSLLEKPNPDNALKREIDYRENDYENLKSLVKSLQQLKNIAVKSLYRGKLTGTSAYKEHD